MIDGAEREFLLSVFLMEAWDAVATIEEATSSLDHVVEVDTLRVVAHRLRGSAALHGLPDVSAIAAQMEDIVENAAVRALGERGTAALALGDLLAKVKHALEGVDARRQVPAGDDCPEAADLGRFFAESSDVLEYFLPEAAEHLENMTASLLSMEQGQDAAHVAHLFRAVHTLKGAAYTVGCRPVGDLAHRVEDLLAVVRDGGAPLGDALVEAIFASADALKVMLRIDDRGQGELARRLARARELLGVAAAIPPSTTPVEVEDVVEHVVEDVVPVAAAESVPEPPPLPVVMRPVTGPSAPPRPADAPRDVRPTIRVGLDRLDALMNLAAQLVSARTRVERGLADLEQTADLLRFTSARMARSFGEFEDKYLDPRLSGAAPPPSAESTSRPGGLDALSAGFEELEFDRYDDFNVLARNVGELSTDVREIQARLIAALRGLRGETGQIQRLGGELRREVGRARMVPISRLFGRFPRLVRETARRAGRTAGLTIEGEAVEVDTSVIEQLVDPLLHLLQNAIVHGIEPAEERASRGKPSSGSLTLRALQAGGAIHVEVLDDGRGIDVEAVKARAVERGVVTAEALSRLGAREALDLIFLPGVSTAAETTDIAGRGVGMDVVRTNVTRLGGEIEIESQVGVGTRFVVRLPLTVAITDILLVRVGRETMAVPAGAVKAVALAQRASLRRVDGEERVDVDQESLRLIWLADVLGLERGLTSDPLVVLALRAGHRSIAVVVDELLRKEEAVVKGIGRFLQGLAPYAGATISAEGRVVLILEPGRLPDLMARPAEVASRVAPVAVPRASTAERRVLLVDDSVSVRRFVRQMLERAGLEVVTAADGEEALERLRDIRVDAVVTDLEMPKVNGYELIRDLRRRPATRTVPIVVLTTRAGDKHLDVARRLGVTHYVTKPVEEQSFVRLVEAVTSEDAMRVEAATS
jgi:chemosensory pili system protein ChpA (sensor histidine kinase/response regulator)